MSILWIILVGVLMFGSGYCFAKARHHAFLARGFRLLAEREKDHPTNRQDVIDAFGGRS